MVQFRSTSVGLETRQLRERIDAQLANYTQLGDGCPERLGEAAREERCEQPWHGRAGSVRKKVERDDGHRVAGQDDRQRIRAGQ